MLRLTIIIGIGSIVSCMSQQDGDELRTGLFKAQKRLLEIEHQMDRSGKASKSETTLAKKSLASSSLRLNKLEQTLRSMEGELDTLRVGVETGTLPDQKPDSDSIGKKIRSLQERVDKIEKNQLEMLNLLEKNSSSNNKKKKNSRKPVASYKGLSKVFSDKKYRHVVEDAPNLIKKSKGARKNTMKYYYAESLYKLGRLKDAALAFNEISKLQQSKTLHPKIQMRMGDCFRHLGDYKAALIYYQELVNSYPKSEEAEWANEQIEILENKI